MVVKLILYYTYSISFMAMIIQRNKKCHYDYLYVALCPRRVAHICIR